LEQLLQLSAADRLKQRYAKFRAYGHFAEKQPAPVAKAAPAAGLSTAAS